MIHTGLEFCNLCLLSLVTPIRKMDLPHLPRGDGIASMTLGLRGLRSADIFKKAKAPCCPNRTA